MRTFKHQFMQLLPSHVADCRVAGTGDSRPIAWRILTGPHYLQAADSLMSPDLIR
jgi:hypothetical protein